MLLYPSPSCYIKLNCKYFCKLNLFDKRLNCVNYKQSGYKLNHDWSTCTIHRMITTFKKSGVDIYQGWPDFFYWRAKFHSNIVLWAATKFLPYFFLHKDKIIDVDFGYFIHKCIINSLVVHPKFDTVAAENLWRAALWPPLIYMITSRPSSN